jgi:hypothetical protein
MIVWATLLSSLNKLYKAGVKGRMWNAIASTYHAPTYHVRVGAHRSRPLKLAAGVKQGSVLSPLLFIIYVNSILEQLDGLNRGIPLLGRSRMSTRRKLPGMIICLLMT